MYFKKLEIFGFKSFADKTVLNFEPGITAIVGPNGCGKSNIFDSIRWVLGEQSIKELRGSSMEDVIFNGTDKKPSLGFAEVSLTFSNESKMLPVEYDEVKIARRLFRSGESEYLINDQTVRLKDVQEMLMGTGIGAEAYSLIQQGKVDLVVSAKPEDRRIIIDEASGITKYKAKKKEAMNKLKLTEDNLVRVADITTEVKRQIASIERQANKARKYKQEFDKLKGLEVKMARIQIGSSIEQKEKIVSEIQRLKGKEKQLNDTLEERSSGLTNEINYLSELEQKINDVHSNEIKLEGQIDLHNRQIGFNQERIENVQASSQKIKEQKEQLIERCRVQQEKIEELKNELKTLENTLRLNEQTLNEKSELLSVLEKNIKEAKDKIREHEEKILSLTSQQVNVRNEVTDIMRDIQGALARKRRLEMENDKVSSEKQQIDQKLQNVEYQAQSIHGTTVQLRFDKQEKEQSLSEMWARFDQLQDNVNQLEKKKLFLKSQKEFIEKLHAQYQDIPDPIIEGRLFTGAPPLDHHTGILGKVKEVKDVAEEHLKFLNSRSSDSGTQQLYEIVCETKFIELDPQQISHKIEEIREQINKLTFEKKSQQQRAQTQQRMIQQLEEEIFSKEKSLSILRAQKSDITDEIKKLDSELQLVDSELIEVKESLVDLKKKEEELNYKLDTLNQDIGWCQNDIKDQQGTIATKSQEKEEITVLIAQIETEMTSDKDKLKSQQDNLKMFTETLDNWLEEMKRIDDEIVQNRSKKEQYEQEITSLTQKVDQTKVEKESLKGVLFEYETQKKTLGEKINSIRSEINLIEDEVEQITQKVHAQEMKEQEISFDEKGIKDRLMQTYKIDLDHYGEEAEESNESSQETQTAETSQVEETAEEVNMEELQPELERLRKRCDSFGNVNLVAIEEYEELKERFEFLTKQQSDLLEAKSQLMNTIRKINRSTRQMFMDTFTKVSEEFRIYFRMLFGGGEAQLVLLDPENVLESGIDIVAKPPGKKLQNISLLSGGEKSLTAIALIFGVFKVNPSPFCVLDEIDAALDESNVGRYSYLLKDFAKIAQFIVITHNKKTIASSDVMYGITMPETGISRIVSVKFADDEKEKDRQEVAVA